jgi:photosystem II stability/assembly factor-like uncharacterized protein
LILALWVTAFSVLHAQGTWEKLDVPTDHYLRSVWFTDSLTGWAAGNGGVIIHTEDGGKNWTVQESQTGYDIAEIVFLNSHYGWASVQNFVNSPYGTILLKTYNGGQDWISVPYPDENIFINCILFRDSLDIWMGGSPHALVHSTDGGETWQQATIDTSTLAFFPVLNVQFYDDQYGYACGGMFEIAGVIWSTTDGGETWYAISTDEAPADEVHELHLYSQIKVLGAGGDPDFGYGVGFMRTDNGGLTWDYEEIDLPGNAWDLDFRNAGEAWAPLGPRKQLIWSLDSGNTWEPIQTPGSTAIFDMMFPDSLHGYAVGDSGAFLKYKPPLGVSADPVELSSSTCFLKNYPNPFAGKTTIQFQIPNYKFQIPNKSQNTNNKIQNSVQLIIYDLFGKEVATILDKPSAAGEYRVEFDAVNIPAGIYYCTMLIDGQVAGAIKLVKGNY